MSGHSHWAGIKHKKGLADAQRSKVFSRLSQEISLAAKEGGGNPEANIRLRAAIDRAKESNMPADNIERAIKRGAGGDGAEQLEEMIIEAYGPGGIGIIVECITNNKNRTIGEIRQILNKHGGKFVEGGGIRWMFEKKGILSVSLQENSGKTKEDIELASIEAGAQDFSWAEDFMAEIYTIPAELDRVKTRLKDQGIRVEDTDLGWVPKESVEVSEHDQSSLEKLLEALDEGDGVQEIYSNAKS